MQNTYHAQTAKFLASVAQNMPPMTAGVMQGWIENPKGLRKALSSLCPPTESTVWKTITLGTHTSADAYREALKKAGRRVSDRVDDIMKMPAFTCAKKQKEVDLVMASVAELGFEGGAQYKDICARAAEVGLALRLAYDDQPRGEWLRIAMEAITDSDGNRFIFAVEHDDDELWLEGFDGRLESFWVADYRFVFVRRSKS